VYVLLIPLRVRKANEQPSTAATTPVHLSSHEVADDQPLLAEILGRNLPSKTKTVRQAWSQTLLSTQHDNSNLWLQNLFQATLEASGVEELVINTRVCLAHD
jgi:hypothetical protein